MLQLIGPGSAAHVPLAREVIRRRQAPRKVVALPASEISPTVEQAEVHDPHDASALPAGLLTDGAPDPWSFVVQNATENSSPLPLRTE